MIGALFKYVLDLRASKRTRLLDEKLKCAVAFLSAADAVTRTSSAGVSASMTASNVAERTNPPASQVERDEARKEFKAREQEGVAAWRDAQKELNAIRLLLPKTANAAETYLSLCNRAGYPDTAEKQ